MSEEDPDKGHDPLLGSLQEHNRGGSDWSGVHNPRALVSPRGEAPRAHLPPATGVLCGFACSPLVSRRVRFGLLGLLIALAALGVTLLFVLPKRGHGGGAARVTRVAVNTWWAGSANASYAMLAGNFSALDAVQAACVAAEESFAFGDHTVGPDGSPDTTGETTLDALLVRGGGFVRWGGDGLRGCASPLSLPRGLLFLHA